MMRNWSKGFTQWLIFIVAYFLLAMVSLETRDPWSLSSTVWLPAGLLLGILCTTSHMYWPVWAVSAGLLHLFASLLSGRPLDIALTFSLLDLAILFPLAMMWHSSRRYLSHYSYHRKTFLLLMGMYIASLLGGFISIFTLKLLDYPVILSHFFTWSLSNVTGCLFGVPFLISHRFFKESYPSVTVGQISALLLVIALFLLPPALIQNDLLKQTILYFVLGISLILSVYWPLRALSIYFLCMTLLVNLTTLSGYGPLAADDLQGIQTSQLYLLALISLGLLAAAYVRTLSLRNHKQQQKLLLLSNLLDKQQPVFFQLSPDTALLSWLGSKSVLGISSLQLPTPQLLLARIHPDDRELFSQSLLRNNTQQIFRQCSVRLLLTDKHYHVVRCNLMSGHPQFGTLGVLMLYN